MTKYRAEIKPLNAAKIGTEAHGYVEFTTEGDNLHIKLEMFDTPANIQHWEHFHGFPDGKDASIPTEAQDVNHDGYIDLPETEPVSGSTMAKRSPWPAAVSVPASTAPVTFTTLPSTPSP